MQQESKLLSLPEDWQRALAVAAHPDDLEYGAASAIARWTTQGKEVVYLLITSGEAGISGMHPDKVGPLREGEEKRSAAAVGVDTVEFLHHKDGVIEYGPALRRDIARAIRRHRPEVILAPNDHLSWGGSSFNFADHRSAGLATLDAAQDAGNPWIFPELMDEELEPWSGVRMICIGGSPQPTHAVDVTDSFDKGVASLEEHRVYLQNLPFDVNPDAMLPRPTPNTSANNSAAPLAVAFQVFTL